MNDDDSSDEESSSDNEPKESHKSEQIGSCYKDINLPDPTGHFECNKIDCASDKAQALLNSCPLFDDDDSEDPDDPINMSD